MIFVDDYRGRFGRMVMSHLMSDASLDELHEFAERLGLKRSWFQNGSAPHYDVCQAKRERAIDLGATPLPIGERDNWQRVYHAAQRLREGIPHD